MIQLEPQENWENKMKKLPKVLESHRTGNRGESFLEFIMSKHCLMNKVVGHRDVGVDYICEWLNGDTPSRILFGIQVKTTEREDVEVIDKGINRRLNELEKVELKPPPFDIEEKTFEYWKGLNIPLYLFLVKKESDENIFNTYYTRLTPVLHRKDGSVTNKINEIKNGVFFKANEGSEFRAVVSKDKMDGGFVRDLFIDSVRCSYQSGSVSYRDPKESEINWPSDALFPTVLGEKETDYVARVKKGLQLLEKNGLIKVEPDFEERIKQLKDSLS